MITSTHLPLFIAVTPKKIRKIYRKNSQNNVTASGFLNIFKQFSYRCLSRKA